jgi:COP9 signalosome complex subunit 6
LCANPATRDLPVTMYESELHIVNEQPTLLFVKVPYKIETGEAERIAVDHVAKISPTGGGGSGSQRKLYLNYSLVAPSLI